MKKLLLRFLRRFYNPNLDYAETEIKKWQEQFVKFIILIILNGILGLLVIVSIIHLLKGVGPGFWYILNIFEVGIIFWFMGGNLALGILVGHLITPEKKDEPNLAGYY